MLLCQFVSSDTTFKQFLTTTVSYQMAHSTARFINGYPMLGIDFSQHTKLTDDPKERQRNIQWNFFIQSQVWSTFSKRTVSLLILVKMCRILFRPLEALTCLELWSWITIMWHFNTCFNIKQDCKLSKITVLMVTALKSGPFKKLTIWPGH